MSSGSKPIQGPGVSEWYAGRTILVTGGTGFMGKVLLEKLLYSCPDVERILVLVRPKRDSAPERRIQTILELPLFERLRTENPKVLSKLRAVEGDMTQPDLGLSESDRLMIQQTVSVIFHCAASLHMETSLREAMTSNVISTHRLLDLAETITNLQVFLHLSTCFTHCDREVLEEELYPDPRNPYEMIRAMNNLESPSTIPRFVAILKGDHPNVYTYTKSTSETLVYQSASKVNAVVVRPSIVTPSWRDPMPGWVDTLNGMVGILMAVGKGMLHSMMVSDKISAQIIPVDVVVNALITIAYSVGIKKTGAVQVYNVTYGDLLSKTWGYVFNRSLNFILENPFENAIWYPSLNTRKCRVMHNITTFCLQLLPAYLIDLTLALTGNNNRFMVQIQKRISADTKVLEYFSTRQRNFRNDKFLALESTLSPEDQVKFHMRIEKELDVDEYMGNVVLGSRQFVMKEPLSSLPEARGHINRLYYVHMVVVCVFYALLLWAGFQLFTWLLGD